MKATPRPETEESGIRAVRRPRLANSANRVNYRPGGAELVPGTVPIASPSAPRNPRNGAAPGPDRNLAMELARVTEAAALAAGRWMGRGDKEAADQAAVDAMRLVVNNVSMDGIVVIGEGEKDEAPMLYNGEQIGAGGPGCDIAVDPIDGTTLTALGRPNAIAVVAALGAGDDVRPRAVRLHGEDRRRARRQGPCSPGRSRSRRTSRRWQRR